MAVVRGDANTAARERPCHGRWKRQPTARGCALDQGDVVVGLHQVPQTRELAHVEQISTAERLERSQVARLADEPRLEAVAGAQRKCPVRSCELLQASVEQLRVGKRRRKYSHSQLGPT